MFIKSSDLIRLMTKAYKGIGMHVGNDAGNIFLHGRQWAVYLLKDYVPKEIVGHVWTLSGAFPDEGEQYLANRDDGNQQEMFQSVTKLQDAYRRAMEIETNGNLAAFTNLFVTSTNGIFALYQDLKEKKLHAVPENLNIVRRNLCEDGEEMEIPVFDNAGALYYRSSHMAMVILTMDHSEFEESNPDLAKTMKSLQQCELPIWSRPNEA